MKIRLYPYKLGSSGCKILQQKLRERDHHVLRMKRSRVLSTHNRKKINWGSSYLDDFTPINKPHNVRMAGNKTQTFAVLAAKGVPIPEWTVDRDVAQEWLRSGHDVVVRHKVTGKGGEGLVVYTTDQRDLPEAPLYTKYFKKKAEYRVHVINGEAVLVQQKLKKRGVEHNTAVRNTENGYVYGKNYTIPPDQKVVQAGVAAVNALGLQFGAADIGWNVKKQEAVVFEVNTAPGITPSTAEIYAEKIEEMLSGNLTTELNPF